MKQKINWVETRGVSSIPSIVKIHLFRHYEQKISTYQLLLLGYLDIQQTKLGVLEATEIYLEGVYHGIAVSPIFKHWTLTTEQFKQTKPCILALVRIEEDLILMDRTEFEYLSNLQ